jgi:DNA-directed RNA polymerase specialized sigma24 family protein
VTTTDLLSVLDADPDRASEKYIDLFERLTKFFQWRGSNAPEDLAQETLRRGFGKVAAGAVIYAAKPDSYFFGIAYNVLRESRHTAATDRTVSLDDLPLLAGVDFREPETRILLAQCLSRLTDEEGIALTRYYTEEDRSNLASELGVSDNALRVRVLRAKRKINRLIGRGTPAGRLK